jgi:excinuclease ABC subunit C
METETLKALVSKFPRRPGIYEFSDSTGRVLYVGKALSLRDRLTSYYQSDAPIKTQEMVKNAQTVAVVETGSEFTALLLEARLIKLHRPRYNVIFRDDKSYLYIFISLGEEFPKVFLTRRPKTEQFDSGESRFEGAKGEYFGPFPSSGTVRSILKWLRRLFPFCMQKKTGTRPCFYAHLGLCSPCPSAIAKTSGAEYEQLKKNYRLGIFRLKRILDGHLEKVVAELTGEMKELSKDERFEEAAEIKFRIERLSWLLTKPIKTQTFLENPNFYGAHQHEAVESLRQLLVEYGLKLASLEKIECFDISNFAGTSAVASQVVFLGGVAEKDLYRRYRIKIDGRPNDFAMLSEAISRRLKHTEWELPQLLIVDGGKPQVSTIHELLRKEHVSLPLIGLAKRFEKIVLIKDHKLIEIELPRRTPALQLLQQIRDEAHRFAITYHRKVRKKAFTS